MRRYKRTAISVAAVFMLIVAITLNNASLYLMASILFVLPITSLLLGFWLRRDLEFRRTVHSPGWSGEVVDFTVELFNGGLIPRPRIEITDLLPAWIKPIQNPPLITHLPGCAHTTVIYSVNLLKRGIYSLTGYKVGVSDPLGLFSFSGIVSAPGEIMVFPTPENLPDLLLSGGDRFGYQDSARVTIHGHGVDPDGVREYRPGDPLRRIHWRTTARTGNLSVIEFDEMRTSSLCLALDLTPGSDVGEGLDTTLEYLVRVAASLAKMAVDQGSEVSLITNGPPECQAMADRGDDQLHHILRVLAAVQTTGDTPLEKILNRYLSITGSELSLFVLTASAAERTMDFLRSYRKSGGQVVIIYADPNDFAPSSASKKLNLNQAVAGARIADAGVLVLRLCCAPGKPIRMEPFSNGYAVVKQ